MAWGRLWTGWVFVSSLALGAPRTVTIAAGDCKAPELAAAAQGFAAAVAGKSGVEALSGEAVLERFRPLPAASAEDLGRQLEAAQSLFYAGTHDKALEALRQAMAGIVRLSVRADGWSLRTRALMLDALVYRALGKKNESNDAQKRVLRIEPGFKLDADYYTPAVLTAFEALRKEVAKAKKHKLTITSQPSGAEVFVDGALAGKTPFSGEYPAGDYQVALANGEALSFTRDVKLGRDEALQVDLQFEGALAPQAPLCVSAPPAQLLDTALRLAALAGAESAVVLRSESRNNEPGWVNATLLEVNKGAKVREAGVRFAGPRRNEVLVELAAFVLTGKPTGAVVATLGATAPAPAPVAAPPADAPVAVPPKAEPPTASAAPVAAPPTVAEAPASGRGLGPRIVSLVLIGAGAIAAGSGAGYYLSGGGDRAALGALLDEQGRLKASANQAEARALDSKNDLNSTTSIVLGAGGAALAAAGAVLFFLMPPDSPAQLSVVPTRDGLWAGAALSF